MEGRDVIGLAQTGTGKTAAFGIPVINRLLSGARNRLRALIIGPTRELAEQTLESLAGLGKGTRLHGVTIYGGVSMRQQVAGLRRGAELVIACPGRLLDHIRQNTISLHDVECLILDEADRMFDMGFLPDIRKILARLPAKRQTLLFSATMPPEIRRLAHEILRNPVSIEIASSRPAESVSHALYPCQHHQKTQLMLALLDKIEDKESVLIFTRTKHRAKRLSEQVSAAGHRATCLQGNLSQGQRKRALDGFRSGAYQVLVATDIAARGIDVSTISHVINFDMPATEDDYTHRIGRTGRAAKVGDAFTLVTGEDESLIRAIERVLGRKIERRQLEGFEYSAKPANVERPNNRATHRNSNHRTARGPDSHRSRRHPPSHGGGRFSRARPV